MKKNNNNRKFISVLDFFPADNTLTEELLENIKSIPVIADTSVEAIHKLGKFDFARLLSSHVEPKFKRQLLPAASKIIDLLVEFDLAEKDNSSSQHLYPSKITVEQVKSLEQMTLRELLDWYVEHKDRAEEVFNYIQQTSLYRIAVAKTSNLAIVANNELDISATHEYIQLLNKPYSHPQDLVEGVVPLSLPEAMGLNHRVLVHPLVEEPLQGLDPVGFDYQELSDRDPELYDAIVFARRTDSVYFPTKPDLFLMGGEILTTSSAVDDRWAKIRLQFQQALKNNHPQARSGIRFWQSSPTKKFQFSSVQTDKLSIERLSPYRRDSHNVAVPKGAYSYADIDAHNVRFNDTILLQDSKVDCHNISGRVFMLHGTVLHCGSHNDDLNIVYLSLAELKEYF